MLDVEVTTGELHEGEQMPACRTAASTMTGAARATVTADIGYV